MSELGEFSQAIALAAHLPETIVCSEPSGFGRAFPKLIDDRRKGHIRGFLPIVHSPRSVLLRNIWPSLSINVTPDVLYSRLVSFGFGLLQLNNQPQTVLEGQIYQQALLPFKHCTIGADITLFRSRYEAAAIASWFGYRPLHNDILFTPDDSVPAPPAAVSNSEQIVIWKGQAPREYAEVAGFIARYMMGFEVIVTDEADPNGADHLASARLIVSVNENPGTASALTAYGKPLVCAGHGIAEYLRNVATFDIYNPVQLVDCLQSQLGSKPSVLRPRADLAPDPIPRSPAFAHEAPLVSIVVTVYDRLKTLDGTLARLQKQSYPNIEIIVVSNNGPQADAVCAKYPNVRYIHRTFNTGVTGEPRNDGIEAARGEFITALDDDDIFFDDHIARMVNACESGADVVYSHFLIQVVEQLPEEEQMLLGYDIELAEAIGQHQLLVNNTIGYLTVFARRSVYERLGGYDNINCYGACEGELWLRMSRHYRLARVDPPTTLYTIRKGWKGSLMATDYVKFADGFEKMYARYPTDGMPVLTEMRTRHVASVRSVSAPPPREPMYPVPPRLQSP